jgi:hypothetical protein
MITSDTSIEFMARFQTAAGSDGWAVFDTENEMYVTLECEGITEDNPNIVGVDYCERHCSPTGDKTVVRRWNFGKPYQAKF